MSTKEAMDLGVSRRRASAPKAGSVWETRMKLDAVKGGIKVFNATHQNPEENTQITCATSGSSSPINNNEVDNKVRAKQNPVGGGSASAKRKTWKSDGFEGSPIQIGRQRSDVSKNLDEQFKEMTDSADGNVKKSPVQIKKTRSVSVQLRKVKSDSTEEAMDENSESGKVKTDELVDNVKTKNLDGFAGEFDKIPFGKKSRSEEEIGVCEVKEDARNADKMDQIKNADEEESDKNIEVEIAEKNLESKEISLQENKPKKFVIEEKKLLLGNQNSVQNLESEEIILQENKPKKFVIEEKKLLLGNQKSVPISPIVKKQLPPAMNHAKVNQNPIEINPIPDSDNFYELSRTQSNLQSFADLIMWRDVSKSSFIFGIGMFAIISSSYTKDLNISFISVVSYLGLAYLAMNFLFRALFSRGTINNNTIEDYVVGEEEAIGLIKLVLPYVNEFLLILRSLFSGDPATTLKLAVILFILARCGGSITMWKMAKLGFIGVFTVPKVCSSYSRQIHAYGTFWIRRFRDAWESCSHKKAVGFTIFSLVWNMSSAMSRIWTVFMLYVAFKCYQHSLIRDGCEQEEGRSEDKVQRQVLDSSLPETRKPKVC